MALSAPVLHAGAAPPVFARVQVGPPSAQALSSIPLPAPCVSGTARGQGTMTELFTTLLRFFDAYLGGRAQQDWEVLLAPSSSVQPARGQPTALGTFSAIDISGGPDSRLLLVSMSSADATRTFSYRVRVVRQNGGWRVESLRAAPVDAYGIQCP